MYSTLLSLISATALGATDPVTLIVLGGAHGDTNSTTLQRLETRLEHADPGHTTVLFTGNYGASNAARLAHVDATKAFFAQGGRVVYLPGHDDYEIDGTRGIHELKTFLNDAYAASDDADDDESTRDDEKIEVMPGAGCGDPIRIKLDDSAELMVFDSEWWMRDHSADPHANEGCVNRTRNEMLVSFSAELPGYRDRRLVVASHHPIRSYGELGGEFSFAAHLSPLPIIGSLIVWSKQAGLIPQYLNHPLVRSYTDMLLTQTQRVTSAIIVSGHESSLQYLQVYQQAQVIAGTSGTVTTSTIAPGEGDFAQSLSGWAEVVLQPSNAARVSLWANDKELFSRDIAEVKTPGTAPEEAPKALPTAPVTAPYTTGDVWQFPPFIQLFVGSFWASAYALQQPYEILVLKTELGGLEIDALGGGLQSNSLKLQDPAGGQWAARSVTKDSSRALPWPQNQSTLINRLLEHGFTASHPEAALAVAKLSDAVGVRHTRPRLLFMPDQADLGTYRGLFADRVVQLEQRSTGDKKPLKTNKLIAKILKNPSKHKPDQEAFLRARLLDLLVNDWDRHEGQWGFDPSEDDDGNKVYEPIPRDRDQAFGNYDGLGMSLGHLALPVARPLMKFNGNYGSIEWLAYGGRDIDRLFLNRITHERWMAIAAEMQAQLTDDVIEHSLLDTWHAEAYALDGQAIVTTLRERRDKLLQAAEDFYGVINRNQDVFGSEKEDLFELTFGADGSARLTISKRKKNNEKQRAKEPYYDRTFVPSETNEVRIYALAGDDLLRVRGVPQSSLAVRFVGGEGEDEVEGASDDTSSGRAITVYDSDEPKGMTVDERLGVHDERSSRSELNQYDVKENHEPNMGLFLPNLIANPDQGAYIGAVYVYTTQGFKRNPFDARHTFGVGIATATLGVALDYHGYLPRSIWLLDQHFDIALRTPNNARNFFGITNRFERDPVPDFYRVKQGLYSGSYGLSYTFADQRSVVGGEVSAKVITTENTAGRFVSLSPDVGAREIGPRYFGGVRVYAQTNTFDNAALPTQGVALRASLEGRHDIARGNQTSLTYAAAGLAVIPFDRTRRFVWLTGVSLEGIAGDYPFYIAPTLGGSALRGYRYQQLAGDIAFVHTNDLRIDVVRIATLLPGAVGITLSIDHGRVFGPSVGSRQYHMTYGGGLWWSILDVLGVTLTYQRGLIGGERIAFMLGPTTRMLGF